MFGGGGVIVLPGLVRLDLGVGGGLDGDGGEVVGVVSCTAQLARQPKPQSDPT